MVGIGLASAEAEPQCIPELHCAVARDARRGRRGEARRDARHRRAQEFYEGRVVGERGMELARREGGGKRRRTREGKKERKETRAQRDSPCSIEAKGGSGRMPIVFSPLGFYGAAREKEKEKKERGS